MLVARRAGARGEAPPRKLTKVVLRVLGMWPKREALDVLSLAAHVGFGATMGALYGALFDRGADRRGAVMRGVGFGLAVWGTHYAGLIPALGIMPPPQRDRRGRGATMFLAHVVYGGVLGALTRGT